MIKLKVSAWQMLQAALAANEMSVFYMLESGTTLPETIIKENLISIISKLSTKKDLISAIIFICKQLDWIEANEVAN